MCDCVWCVCVVVRGVVCVYGVWLCSEVWSVGVGWMGV